MQDLFKYPVMSLSSSCGPMWEMAFENLLPREGAVLHRGSPLCIAGSCSVLSVKLGLFSSTGSACSPLRRKASAGAGRESCFSFSAVTGNSFFPAFVVSLHMLNVPRLVSHDWDGKLVGSVVLLKSEVLC